MPIDRSLLALMRRSIPAAVRAEGRPANVGRVDGAVAVTLPDGSTDKSRLWVRVQDEGMVTEAVAWRNGTPPIPDLPVRVIDLHGDPYIVGLNQQAAYAMTEGKALLEEHAWQHGRYGVDPLYVTGLQFLPLAVVPSSPPAMTVYVEPGWGRKDGTDWLWSGGTSGSLSGYVPGSSDNQHFVVVCLDLSNLASISITIVDGADVATGTGDALLGGTSGQPIALSDVEAISIDADYLPLAVVRFYNGQTAIMPTDIIYDRRPWGGLGSGLVHPLQLDTASTLTISSGAVTVTTDFHTIAAESGTEDYLDTITAAAARQWVLLQADAGDTIYVNDGEGNIKLNHRVGFVLSGAKKLLLFWDGTQWTDVNSTGDTAVIFSQTADQTVADTTSETTLFGTGIGSLSIDANTLQAGMVINVRMGGYLSDAGNPTLTIKAYLGGTEIASTGAITLNTSTDGGWELELDIVCRSTGATGTVVAHGTFDYDDGDLVALLKKTTTTVDTTGALAVDIRATWGTADPGNTITAQLGPLQLKQLD